MNNIIKLIAYSLVTLVLLISIFSLHIFTLADISEQGTENPTVWHARLNLIFNSFYEWKYTPLLGILSAVFSSLYPFHLPWMFLLSLSILAVSSFAYFLNSKLSMLFSAALSISLTVCFPFLFSLDSTVLLSCTFGFCLLIACKSFLTSDKVKILSLFIFILTIYFLLTSANQLAIIIAPLIFYLALSSSQKTTKEKTNILGIVLFSFLLYAVMAPIPFSPEYPGLSHVVPDDNLPGNVMPMFGSHPPIPFVNRLAIKDYFFWPAIVIFASSLLLYINSSMRKVAAGTACILGFFCFLDICCPESISLIAPIYSLNRVIPGLFFIPIVPVALALVLIAMSDAAIENKRQVTLVLVTFIILSGIGYQLNARAHSKAQVLRQLDDEYDQGRIDTEKYMHYSRILGSPSYNLISETGLSVLTRKTSSFSVVPLASEDFSVLTSSPHSSKDNYGFLFDGRDKTRWSPQLGKQEGQEILELEFKTPRTLQGLYLDCGSFTADFPRGIEIQAANQCAQKGQSLVGDFKTVYSSPRWEGNLSYTEGGFPYYGSQSEVKIIFSSAVDLKCLRIKQTAKEKSFDWSIAELSVLQ